MSKTRKRKDYRVIANQKYFTVSSAAKYLGVSRTTLWNYSKPTKKRRPLITSLRFGLQLFYTQAWLDEFIAERTELGFGSKRNKK